MSFAGDSVSLADRGESSVATLDSQPKEAFLAPLELFRAPSCSAIDDGGASLEPSQDAPRTAHALRTREAYLVCPRPETSPRDGGGVRDAVCFDATVDDGGPSFLNGPVIDAFVSTDANPTRVVPRTPVRDFGLSRMSLSDNSGLVSVSPPLSREAPPEIGALDDDVVTVATCDLSLAAGVRRHARGRLEMQIEREDGYDTYDYDRNRRAPGRIPHVARNEGVNNGEHDRAIEGRFRGADADLSFGAHTAFGTNPANGA